MLATIISSNYRKKGATDILVKSSIDGLASGPGGEEIKRIDLFETDFEYCKGCMVCLKEADISTKKCLICDGMNEIMDDSLRRYSGADLPRVRRVRDLSDEKVHEKYPESSYLKNGRHRKRIEHNAKRTGAMLPASGVSYPLNKFVGITKNTQKAPENLHETFEVFDVATLIGDDTFGNDKNRERYSRKAFELGRKTMEKQNGKS